MKKFISLLLAAVMAITLLAACGVSAPSQQTSAPSTAAAREDGPNVPMDPPVHLTSVRRSVANTVFGEGHDYENNVWTPEYEKMGITWNYIWMEDGNFYNDRLNVAISSNDIPDFFRAYDPHVNMMLKGEMLMDITDVFEKYASDITKFAMKADDGVYMAGGYINGRLMALPQESMMKKDQIEMLWVRSDWLENVGLAPPKTLDEFLAVCEAFTNGDPDGNGQKDTYAMGAVGVNNFIKDWGGFRGLFMMWDVQPGVFFSEVPFFEKDASGEIIWSGSKPAMTDALRVLQEMYAKGYLAKDFPTMNVDVNLVEDLTNGTVGMFYGPDWLAGWPLNSSRDNNPEADWIAIQNPTATGKASRIEFYRPNSSWNVVSSKCKYPEAVIKMLNVTCDIRYHEDRGTLQVPFIAPPGVTDAGYGFVVAPLLFNSGIFHKDEFQRMSKAIDTGDPSGLLASQLNGWNNIQLFFDDPSSGIGWAAHKTWANLPGFVYNTVYEAWPDSTIVLNQYMGLMTETMARLMPLYKSNAEELLTQIIVGQKQPEDWLNWINNVWPGMGGNEILAEVKAAAK